MKLPIGIALIVLAALGLTFKGITYTTTEEVLRFGQIQATAQTEKTIPIPPLLSAVILVAGVALTIVGAKEK